MALRDVKTDALTVLQRLVAAGLNSGEMRKKIAARTMGAYARNSKE
jgi:hypothetical protein